MKIQYCFVISLCLHGLWWLSPTHAQPNWETGAKATVQKKPPKPLIIAFSAMPVATKATQSQTNSSQFNGKTIRAQQQTAATQIQKQATKKQPTHTQKPAKEPPIKLAKTPPVQKAPKAAPIKATPTHTHSAQQSAAHTVSTQNNATDLPVQLNTLPLFKAPRPALSYPLKAKRRGIQGVSVFQIELNKHGNIVALKLIKSSGHPSLDNAAKNNVQQWQFHPVTHQGKAVNALFTVPIEFKIS